MSCCALAHMQMFSIHLGASVVFQVRHGHYVLAGA